MKDNIIRKQSLANMWMGVGLLLVIVPVGVSVLSILIDPKDPFREAQMLGWAFYLVLSLLPIGVVICIGSFSWMALLKKQLLAALEEDDELEEESQRSKLIGRPTPGERPDLRPPSGNH
ncbi:MAG: hypothetical protein AAGA18_09100 [Verrucomicrobiota bacterium]